MNEQARTAPAGGRGGEADAATLLTDLDALRHRARVDRRGYAFPLFLFGGLILVAPVLYAADGSFTEGGVLVDVFRTNSGVNPISPGLIALYWLLTLVVGFAATAWWYRRRAEGAGVETDTRGFLVAVGAAIAGFLVGVNLLGASVGELSGAWTVNVPLIVGSVVAAGVVAFWSTRAHRSRAERGAGTFVAAVFAAVGFAAFGVYITDFPALSVIAVGLLALAWVERSVLLGVTGVLFTLTAIPAMMPITVFGTYVSAGHFLYRLGFSVSEPRVEVLLELVVPAAVLLVASAVAALTSASSRRAGR